MKLSTLTCTLAALQTAAAHTVFTTLFVNDVDQGDATCVRMPTTPSNATFPINDLSSSDMACGYDGTKGVARVCQVSESANLSFTFREYPDASAPGVIDVSHKGPCAVYMKAVKSAVSDSATGDGWFKIFDEGYDNTTSQWCTEKLMQNNSMLSAQIPDGLAGGYYLVRPELLSLHQSDKSPPNPQFYVGCAQIFLNSTSTSVPQETVEIPGYVNISDPSVLFNIYTPKFPYFTPGPPVYEPEVSNSAVVATANTQAEGLLPQNAILTNANWWGIELDSYSTSDGCWNASINCWDQAATCYSQAPPTGSKNCKIWEQKCTGIQTACNDNDFNGPPNQGKVLTPDLVSNDDSNAEVTSPEPSNTVSQQNPSAATSLTVHLASEPTPFQTSQPQTTLQTSYTEQPTPSSSEHETY
ncbi:hypothetical protein G7Y89_g3989 [Cudoniella acicularis]|uniref:AA9 family lytic polysaccharide monooxygenase n=1 Tax=Cudoniella acicularis TaxID=354080 RepID=A0A8H4RSE1_9HELO|nr:hypothetical protein G7Y89_g3989 [Cudoniella acicularis]